MRFILFALMFMFLPSCSIVDGGDRDELEARIEALPPPTKGTLRTWAAVRLVRKWLEGRPPSDKIGGAECRGTEPDGSWSGWKSMQEYTVRDVATCMMMRNVNYETCVEQATASVQKFIRESFKDSPFADRKVECRPYYVPAYEPDTVAAEARGSDTAEPGDMNRLAELLTVSQIADALIASDVPPPLPGGFAVGGALGGLLPILCALGADWGCPDNPLYPGGGDKQ